MAEAVLKRLREIVETHEQPCPDCGGSGWLTDGECAWCGGSRTICDDLAQAWADVRALASAGERG